MNSLLWLAKDLESHQEFQTRRKLVEKAWMDGYAMYDGKRIEMAQGDSNSEDNGYSTFGNIAILDIKGILSNDDSFWAWLFDMPSYSAIQRKIISAATDSQIQAIVMAVDSPGGIPSNLPDTAALIRRISVESKPIYAYSPGSVTSAAYWLAAAARKVYIGPTTEIGSIGTLAVHQEFSKANEKDGIGMTVIRSGKYKALATPHEPLSDKARSEIQNQIDAMTSAFENSVKEYRGFSSADMQRVGEGRVFLGQDAVNNRLADGVTTLNSLVEGLQTNIDSNNAAQRRKKSTPDMPGMLNMSKVQPMMTSKEIAMTTASESGTVTTAQGNFELTPPGTVREPDSKEPTASTQVSGTLELKTSESDIISLLREDLHTAQVQLVEARTQAATLERELTAVKGTQQPLMDIVAASIQTLQAKLGGVPMPMTGMPAEALVAMYTATHTKFCEIFPIGGKAVVGQIDEAATQLAVEQQKPLQQTRVRLAKVGKSK